MDTLKGVMMRNGPRLTTLCHKALDERRDFFSLKLVYRGEELAAASFGDGQPT